ncbi:MAG: arylsulfatase [Planctomycetota bacterium]|nr:MAG: arylsulfatase [Planctomycetota bacterium]REJ90890.1 MAG: arylsulfatase [Planctomycetota bacterium]REK17667.1 MAG: arylsulfatase [Planctomycetota bacterium]REK46720.1 MAG: arylsulfatase [Planctomycetota bacterium]
MMADDMGFSDIGCYGGEVKTPTLDRLAAGGLRFTQFYNTGRCCPTRASLMTGLYSHQAGIGHMVRPHIRGEGPLPGYLGHLNDECVTIAEVLRRSGYRTMLAGKWHVTPFDYDSLVASHRATWPLQRGFHEFYGTIAGAGSFFWPEGLMRQNTFIDPDTENYYYTDAISDNAARFVRSRENERRPFFLYVAYTAPHWPLHALPEDIEKYDGVYDKGWDRVREERMARMVEMGILKPSWKMSPRNPFVKSWEEAPHKHWEAYRMAVYAAQIDRMDQGIGKIVTALEETDQLENTLILFLADNGGCHEPITGRQGGAGFHTFGKTLPEGAFRGGNFPDTYPGPADTFASYGMAWANASNTPFRLFKHFVHEGGIASPLVVHWPHEIQQGGALRHQPGHLIDIMATCVDVAGARYPQKVHDQEILPLEGKSLVPAFADQPIEREAIYWEHEGNRAVRRGKWKLVARYKRPWELYDMEADRAELDNLIESEPELAQSMIDDWHAWAWRSRALPSPYLHWLKEPDQRGYQP